jgi:glycogen synthase
MTTDAVGGVWDYALELARGLTGAQVEVVLAVMGPGPGPHHRAAAQAIAGIDLVVGPYRLEWQEDPWDDVARAGDWLLELEARCGCDLVHLNGFAHGALPFRSPKLVVGHSCVLSWWQACHGVPAPASWGAYRQVATAGLAGADCVVAPTRWMLAALEEHYGALRVGCVIPNGRSLSAYHAGDKQPFVLSAGRLWDQAKNAAALARVAPRVPWPVKIAGADSVEHGGPRNDALPEGAELLGRLPSAALARLYAEAAIYALPARYEPFGLTVLEAALSECALVLGDIPTLRELWEGAALFVPPDDEDALELILRTLMNQPELCALLALRARQRALKYGATQMMVRYLALYRTLTESRSASGGEKEIWSPCVS